jgi:hypothetical protein
MEKHALVLIVILVSSLTAAYGNTCMDCAQRYVVKQDIHGGNWLVTEGMCCTSPCYPTEFSVIEEDRGHGCRVGTRTIVSGVEETYCNSTFDDYGCPPPPPPTEEIQHNGSPIVLDLGDNSYRLTSTADGVRFDLRNEGRRIQTAWTRLGVENAFLALDRNGNGVIDSGAELFGNYTRLRSGELAQNGFQVLAELDENTDGVIDSSDSAWDALLLWVDRNHDGNSTVDELATIASSAVSSLETRYSAIGKRDQWGNTFRFAAHFRFGSKAAEPRRAYYDVFFKTAE